MLRVACTGPEPSDSPPASRELLALLALPVLAASVMRCLMATGQPVEIISGRDKDQSRRLLLAVDWTFAYFGERNRCMAWLM